MCENVLRISDINSRGSQVNSSLQWTLHDHTIDTVCVAGWHVLFTLTIYTPTDSQGKGAAERLEDGEQNVKKGTRQHTHTRTQRKSTKCTT